MDLTWKILLVFLVCAETQNVTEVKVELGQNVTLNCSGDNSDTYWFTEINTQVRGFISRTYSAFKNRLIITNITADDCRLYFCGRRINGSTQFLDTFRLVSDVAPSPLSNVSKVKNTDQQHDVMYHIMAVIWSSFVLTVFLSLGLLGSLIWVKKKKNCTRQVTHPSPYTTGTRDSQQYEELHFLPVRAPLPAAPSDGIYVNCPLPSN